MRRKLTIIGALAAFALATLGVFHGTASAHHIASHSPIQTFAGGAGNVKYITCYGPNEPTGGMLTCPAGDVSSSSTSTAAVAAGTNYDEWNIITVPRGSRLATPISYIPSGPGQFSYVSHMTGDVVGQVQAEVDILCDHG